MDELEETLNRVLSDPVELERLSRLAGQLLGGETPGTGETGREESNGPDPGMMERLRGLVGGLSPGGDDNMAALLKALAPYLREDRRQKLQKAMRLAKAARIAGAAMNEFGGEGGAV